MKILLTTVAVILFIVSFFFYGTFGLILGFCGGGIIGYTYIGYLTKYPKLMNVLGYISAIGIGVLLFLKFDWFSLIVEILLLTVYFSNHFKFYDKNELK